VPRLERASAWLAVHPRALASVAVPLLPLVFLGYGTDIDTAGVRASGAAIRDGGYEMSRPPGSLVHEGATAVLDAIGGSVATNLASLVAGTALVMLLARVLRRAGAQHAELAALAVAANPYFVIAATSLADHLWGLAFLVGGIDARQRSRPWVAAVPWGLAIGCRASTGLLVAAVVLGEIVATRHVKRESLVAAGGAALIGALLFIPSWLSVGRSSAFLDNALTWPGAVSLVGRWAVKHELFLGLPAVVVLLVGLGPLIAGLRRWRTNPLVGFALVAGLASEVLYLRLPLKLAHLLPILLCLVIVAAMSPRVRAPWLVAFAIAQLAWGLGAVRVVIPDVPQNARGAHIDVALVAGPLVTDVRCRLADRRLADRDRAAQHERAVALFECANSWGYGYGGTDLGRRR
jgi:hypothetical protein